MATTSRRPTGRSTTAITHGGRSILFYELDRDSNSLRAGVVRLSDESSPITSWMEPTPGVNQLNSQTYWLSESDVAYPTQRTGSKFERVNTTTGRVVRCTSCATLQNGHAMRTLAATPSCKGGLDRGYESEIPKDARLVECSSNGNLLVFVLDTSEKLSLLFQQKHSVVVVFENSRW
jgi:hypothetical protein